MTIQTETPNLLVLKERELTKRITGGVVGLIGMIMIYIFWGELQKVGLSIFLIICGLCLNFFSKTIIITIDRVKGKIQFASSGLMGTSIQEVDIKHIKAVELDENYPAFFNNHRAVFLQYCLIFNLGNNQVIDIPINSPAQDFSIRGNTSLLWGERNSITALVKKIADFTGVKFNDYKLPF
jgi:hypothetical protein